MERARLKERLQAVFDTLAEHGCYVFDELPTEAGILDYLVVGPVDICTVVVRTDRGIVAPASGATDDDELYLNNAKFKDSPRQQVYELTEAVGNDLSETNQPIDHLICFTEATIHCEDGQKHLLIGACTIWGLLETLHDDDGEEELNAADIEEFAEIVERIYKRPPIVRPHSREGHH